MIFDENSEDEKLMQAYQNGASSAFDLLFKRHSSRVYGFVLNRLKNRATVDDVFQAIFMKLHQSRLRYDPAFPFSPWLFTICKSVITDYMRKQKLIEEDVNEEIVENTASDSISEEVLSTINLDGLTDKERLALKLRYTDDLKFDEIAIRLQTSPNNARQLISRAIKHLKNLNEKKGI
jgi:RNA polymerase sigma-70 factor (ECF subfamily)